MINRANLHDIQNSVLDVRFGGSKSLFSSSPFIVSNLLSKVRASFRMDVTQDEREALFEKGVNCLLLKPGADWQKGKLKISVEFIPDEVDSPLDDIRQAIADDSQPV